ncbi:MAG: carbohydrate ABC transporter substrate-binding protein [Rhizobiales bacterium]|nr:carbohydrate ABC transporter substrate-binding protein [Hyphomicrobiales bacterium]
MTRHFTRAALLALATTISGSGIALAQSDTLFLSTQLRPVEEATLFRGMILNNAPQKVTYAVEEPAAFAVRVDAETKAGKRTVSLLGALHGEIQPLVGNSLDPVDDLVANARAAGIPENLLSLGKLGTDKQQYIPWMQATYVMAAKKEALQYLPAGADINALTYAQLREWAKNIQEKTGKRALGFPAGPKGLMARFFQGYLYPSYTGGVVSTFKSAEAEAMWAEFKALWAHVNPSSTNYDFMQEALLAGDVMIAFDHVARLKDALIAAPNAYVTFPAPSGPKGRGYMPVIAGLAIAKDAPNRPGAVATINHLLSANTQVRVAANLGFFPVVKADLPADLSGGIKLLVEGVAKTQGSKDALVSLLPVGLGAKGGEFSKVYMDTFQRIVLRNEDIKTALAAQATALKAIMDETKAPCWAPDKASTGPCPIN